MTVPVRPVAIATAVLIALFATNVSGHAIDIFSIALPKLIFGIPWSASAVVPALLIAWPIARARHERILNIADALFGAALVFWAIRDMAAGPAWVPAISSSVIPWLCPWLALTAVRAHVKAFRDPALLVRAFVAVAAAVALLHLGALLADSAGRLPVWIDRTELVDRNSVSLLLVAATFLIAISPDEALKFWALPALVALGLVHSQLNHSRSGELGMLVALALALGRQLMRGRSRLYASVCLLLCVTGGAAVAASRLILATLHAAAAFGRGDAGASTAFRAMANQDALMSFWQHPWFGVGWFGILQDQSGGYISHTLYVIVLTAFGMFGAVPLLAAVIFWLRDTSSRAARAAALLLLTFVTSFVNDPLTWFGVVIGLAVVFVPDAQPENDPIELSSVVRYAFRWSWIGAAVGVVLVTMALRLVSGGFVGRGELDIPTMPLGLFETDPPLSDVLTAVESSHDAQEFVNTTLLAKDPTLGRACRVRAVFERQALVLTCQGRSPGAVAASFRALASRIVVHHDQLLVLRLEDAKRLLDQDRTILDALTSATSRSRPIPSPHASIARVNSVVAAMPFDRAWFLQERIMWYSALVSERELLMAGHAPTTAPRYSMTVTPRGRGLGFWLILTSMAMLGGFVIVASISLGWAASHRTEATLLLSDVSV